jgi:hypothetical protein
MSVPGGMIIDLADGTDAAYGPKEKEWDTFCEQVYGLDLLCQYNKLEFSEL